MALIDAVPTVGPLTRPGWAGYDPGVGSRPAQWPPARASAASRRDPRPNDPIVIAITHATAEHDPAFERAAAAYRQQGISTRFRGREEVERLFGDLELIDPGVVVGHCWHPDGTGDDVTDAQVSFYGRATRKS